jgi:lactoylglutathione lyase
MKFAKTVVYV